MTHTRKLPQALVSLVVTETERQMTWSRLEGLLLHWAVSRTPPPKGEWELPPRGWRTLPDTTIDAGAHHPDAARMHIYMCACMYACMHARMHVCMHCSCVVLKLFLSTPPSQPLNPCCSGGAWQTTLEKHPLPEPDGTMGPAPMYTALLSLPLEVRAAATGAAAGPAAGQHPPALAV
jgi:hypothetical protein